MKLSISRKEHFNAAHRLHNSTWSDQKNIETFGRCNNPNFHGHTYELIVTLQSELNTDTGYVYDMKKLSQLIKHHIIDKFDYRNLNLDTTYFEKDLPTLENLAITIWKTLRIEIDRHYELKIRLYETERNFVDYPTP